MTERKTQRNTSQLTALECADRIRTELGDKPDRIAKRKQAVEDEENERSSARIKALLDRCVPEQRDDLPRIMVAINCPLNGIELQSSNDAVPPDAIPAGAQSEEGAEMPVGAQPMSQERQERVARLTGKGRA